MRSLVCFLAVVVASLSIAAPVNPHASNGIASFANAYGSNLVYALCVDGSVYLLGIATDHGPMVWQDPDGEGPQRPPLPVPIEEIVDWYPYAFLTGSGELWVFDARTNAYYLAPVPPNNSIQPFEGSLRVSNSGPTTKILLTWNRDRAGKSRVICLRGAAAWPFVAMARQQLNGPEHSPRYSTPGLQRPGIAPVNKHEKVFP